MADARVDDGDDDARVPPGHLPGLRDRHRLQPGSAQVVEAVVRDERHRLSGGGRKRAREDKRRRGNENACPSSLTCPAAVSSRAPRPVGAGTDLHARHLSTSEDAPSLPHYCQRGIEPAQAAPGRGGAGPGASPSINVHARANPSPSGTIRPRSGGRSGHVGSDRWPERPNVDKPEGDIPFELGIEDITVGDGAEAAAGTKVSVHYVGVAFSTGEEFDASWNRGQPFEFKLGKGQVIPGWDAGVAGMKVGGRRKLTIPSAMAYGARGAGNVIAPHEPLVFVVDLLSVD